MYARQSMDGRLPRNLRIPRNYSGNAFRREEDLPPGESSDPLMEIDEQPSSAQVQEPAQNIAPPPVEQRPAAEAASKLFPSPGFRLDLGHLLNRGGGIGFEEILIIGVILLLSQSETKDDLIFLLLLLLFIQ